MAKLKSTHVYGTLLVDEALTVSTDATITGNLTVNGTTSYTNVVTTTVLDPIVEYGGGANNAALTSNDNKDRGSLLHYYSGSAAVDAFMGWKNDDGEFIVASNVTISDNVVTVGDYGNLHAGWFIGEGSALANVTGANVTGYVPNADHANLAGYVDQATQANITLLGTQTSLTVGPDSGNINTTLAGNGDITSSGITKITNTTASTTTGTGALVVSGGVGISGNLFVGGTLHANIEGTTSAPGSNTNIQFNDEGTSNATAGLTFNKTSNTLNTTNIVLSGSANVGADINLTNANAVVSGSNVDVTGTTQLKLNGGASAASNVTLDISGAVIKTSGGNVSLNNSGDFTVSTGNLVLPNADISSTGTANIGDALNVANTANVGSVIARDIAENEIPFADGFSRLTGATSFTYTSGTLAVDNANIANAFSAANITDRNLTSGRVTFADTGGKLSDSGNLTFDGSALSVPTVSATDVNTANVTANSLTSTGIVVAGTGGKLTTDSGIQYASGVLTVTANVAAGNVKTDNLLKADGTPWDFQLPAGSNTQVQFNADGDFGASANFSYNSSSFGGGGLLDVGHGANGYIQTDGMDITKTANIGNISVSTNANVGGDLQVTGSANVATDLDVGGNTVITGTLQAGDTTIAGNLTVTGTTTSVNTTVTQLTDPVFDLGGGANGAALTTDDGMDRGLVLHSYEGATGSGTAVERFMGWDNSAGEFILAKNVTVADNVVTVNGSNAAEIAANLADLRIGNIYAYNANFGGVVFSNGNVTLGGGVFVGNLQGNVTGSFSGNLSGNISVTGGAGAIQFSDSSNTLVSSANLNFDNANATLLVGGNSATGTVEADFLTGTITTNAQPNITSVGTLIDLDVAGNVAAANVLTDNLLYANGQPWDLQQAAGSNTEIQFNDGDNFASSSKFTFDPAGNVLTVDGTANVTGTINAADVTVSSLTGGRVVFSDTLNDKLIDSANLTFDATSNTLTTVTANVSSVNSGNITNTGTITSGNIYANSGTIGATYLTGTLTTNAQSNITSVGTLTALTVSGLTTLADIGNVKVSGGTSGQVIVTDGAGNLSFETNDTSRIVNGTSNVSIPTADGAIDMVVGGTTIVEIDGTGANVTGVVTASGNISGTNLNANTAVVVTGTGDATNAATGSIRTDGGISAKGNIYAGHSVGFADNTGNTDSKAYIQFNATANSLDFIFN